MRHFLRLLNPALYEADAGANAGSGAVTDPPSTPAETVSKADYDALQARLATLESTHTAAEQARENERIEAAKKAGKFEELYTEASGKLTAAEAKAAEFDKILVQRRGDIKARLGDKYIAAFDAMDLATLEATANLIVPATVATTDSGAGAQRPVSAGGKRVYTSAELSDPKFYREHRADILLASKEGRIRE